MDAQHVAFLAARLDLHERAVNRRHDQHRRGRNRRQGAEHQQNRERLNRMPQMAVGAADNQCGFFIRIDADPP